MLDQRLTRIAANLLPGINPYVGTSMAESRRSHEVSDVVSFSLGNPGQALDLGSGELSRYLKREMIVRATQENELLEKFGTSR